MQELHKNATFSLWKLRYLFFGWNNGEAKDKIREKNINIQPLALNSFSVKRDKYFKDHLQLSS